MRFRLRWLVALAAIAVIGWGAYAALMAKQVSDELSAASSSATQLKQAITDGSKKATDKHLSDLQVHAQAAQAKTDSLTWRIATKVPFVGDDAEAVQVVASVVDDVANTEVTYLLGKDGALAKMTPQQGRIDIAAVEGLQDPITDTNRTLQSAVQRLNTVDPDDLIGPLETKYADLSDQITTAAHAVDSAETALEVLPQMLGRDGKRTYLLVMQNNAEIRATGGLPGAVAVVTTDNGKISLVKQVAGNKLGMADKPVLPLTKAERELYGPQLGTYFLDANFTPDMPRVAELMKARWEQVYDDQIDGVLMVDAVTLGYLLKATGPINVQGTELTSDNAVDELLHGVYMRYDDPDDMDRFFEETAARAFTAITNGQGDSQEMVKALAKAAGERRILVHNFDETQAALAGTTVASDVLSGPGTEDNMVITLNDTTGSKMSYYLRYTTDACVTDNGSMQTSMTIESTAPKDAADLPDYITGGGVFGVPAGVQAVTIRIYSPVGAEISDFRMNGKKSETIQVEENGRQVTMTYAFLEAGAHTVAQWIQANPSGREVEILNPGIKLADSGKGEDC